MVATRRGAKSALEGAPAPSNTLNAPPKRGGGGGGKKKAIVEEAAAPASSTTATKRKAKAEPEADAPAMTKKTAAGRAAKAEAKAEPAPAAPKRATRGRKAETVEEEEQEPEVAKRVIKPATTRARKAAAKAVVEEDVVEEAEKPASRKRKAPAEKAAANKKAKAPVDEEVEAEKPAPRTRKAAPRKACAPTPVLAPRATRGRNVAAPPQDSPLKAPARKPTKKAAAALPAPVTAAMAEPEPIEEPFTEFPGVPSTPAPFAQDFTARRAMRELPQYPNTPAHIQAPISSKAAMAELPGYPKTPAHIKAPISSKAALAEMPDYPKTPTHIKAPSPIAQAMAVIPEESETPVEADATVEDMAVSEDTMAIDNEIVLETSNEEAMHELPDYPTTPAHIAMPLSSKDALKALPAYPETPAHIKAPLANKDALNELPGYPKTPAHIQGAPASSESRVELPEDSHSPINNASSPTAASAHEPAITGSTTPTRIASPVQEVAIETSATPKSVASTTKAGSVAATPLAEPSTPTELSSPITEGNFVSGTPRMPANITWGVTDQEAFEELPEGYPATPAHITAPMTPRRALAELPNYPTTPSMAIEAAIQEEICASVKKQTPSPLAKKQSPFVVKGLEDVSFSFAHDDSEMTVVTDMDSEVPGETTTKVALAPPQLAAPPQLNAAISVPEPASPIKSALRSPKKIDPKTPKKAVTWDDPKLSDRSPSNKGPLQGMTFLVDVKRKGKDQEFLFRTLLEELGAKVVQDWESAVISHVIYKDGNRSTLRKIIASKGAIKCVNVGYLLDCEKELKRLDENPYLVDLSIPIPDSPKPVIVYSPMRTPARYRAAGPCAPRSLPTTPTSSELDRSMVVDDDKENSELGLFWTLDENFREIRTMPQKKSRYLFAKSPIKTPSQPKFLAQTPIKPQSVLKPATTAGKKHSMEESFPSIIGAPPRKPRFT
ncbi:hypothetical protein J1614_007669 [Plenodomus biglobosus]|nr:hypothetical protein J1614_007669 [Plenodomus biglobosus]